MKPANLLVLLPFLAACAQSGANYTPVIDGPIGPNYSADLAQCQQLAASQATVDSGSAGTAAAGATAAAATTAVINNKGNNVRDAAIVGAVAGLTADAFQNTQSQEAIVRNCIRGRGYNVVG